MRKLLMAVSMAAAAACSGSASTAQSDAGVATAEAVERRTYKLAGFDGIEVVGPHKVTVIVGPAFSVSAEGPRKTLDWTEVTVEGGLLKIHPDPDRDWDKWEDYDEASFTVTLPRIARAGMVGSGAMTIDRVAGASFSGSIAGSGTLDLAEIAVDSADFSLAGSGDLIARGRAKQADVSIAGSGTVRGHGLASERASVSIAGSGDAELTVDGEARVSIVGSGDAEIAGSARCTVSRIGSGDVSCARIERETEFSLR